MYHSITFDIDGTELNTWDDWHLIPTTRPVINPPGVKTNYVDIPGGYGSIDLTESLRGSPNYEDRTGSLEFIVMHDYWTSWNFAYAEILDKLHGKKCRAVLEDDPWYYYAGRWSVNQWNSDERYSTITLDYQLYPFKKELCSSREDWLWDPFDFENGVIREYDEIHVITSGIGMTEGTVIKIPGTREQIVPTIVLEELTSDEMYVTYKGKKYYLKEGVNIIPEIAILGGVATLEFFGTGLIRIDYRGGEL